MAETLLEVRGVVVRYGDLAALQIPSLSVISGEVLALIGPNGAGKSTLVRIMALLQSPTSGSICFDGQEPLRKDALRIRRRIATVFQDPLLLKGTVFDNVAMGLKMRGLSRREIEARVEPWLSRLNIQQLASHSVHTLSGGEAQRSSLARAFVLNPDLLLLDEPFSPLDPISRETLLRDLHRILRETGTATVLVTHHRDEAFMLADRVGVLDRGTLLQLGSPRDVFMYPLTEKVAEIVGVENRIPAIVQDIAGPLTTIKIDSQMVQVEGHYDPGSRVILCIRAEELHLTPLDVQAFSENNLNRLNAKVTSTSSGIPHDQVTLEVGNCCLFALVPRTKLSGLRLRNGDDVVITFSPKSVHLIRQ